MKSIFNDTFIQFSSHYGYEPQDWHPSRGMKKVMWKIKWAMFVTTFSLHPRWWMIYHPYENYCMKNVKRVIRNRMIKRVRYCGFARGRMVIWSSLPKKGYPAFKQLPVTTNKCGEMRFDVILVHLLDSCKYSNSNLIQYWERIIGISPKGEILYHLYIWIKQEKSVGRKFRKIVDASNVR